MMTPSKSKRNFWSRLLFSMIAIFVLPGAQGLENQPAESYSSSVAIQQALKTAKVAQEVKRQQFQQSCSIPCSTKKLPEIQPHFVEAVLNLQAPIRAGPLLI